MICDIFQHSPVFRIGGDEFVVIIRGRDYIIRKELVLALHDRSVEHISKNEAVVSGGLSEYNPGVDSSFHDVFERADALMYEEKKLLKGMGAISREDAEAAAKPVFPKDEDAEILNLKRHILIVEDEQINQMILGNMLGESYLEFFTGTNGDLEILPGGINFFRDAREKMLEGVSEADMQKLREATSKANLIQLAEQEEAIRLSFAKLKNGVPIPYSLQTIRTRESDHHHLVIGIRQESKPPAEPVVCTMPSRQ